MHEVHVLNQLLEARSWEAAETKVHELLGLLHKLKDEQEPGVEPDGVTNRNDIIRYIQKMVEQHLHEDVSLQLLSDKVHLHPKYLSWLYKNETGEGLSDYVLRLKMERAAYWLRHSRKKVYEIAEHVGYQHTSYFIRVFKEQFQMTPQQFRDHKRDHKEESEMLWKAHSR
jgi:two-component system response regulator YesN